jgi:hypothetical protein
MPIYTSNGVITQIKMDVARLNITVLHILRLSRDRQNALNEALARFQRSVLVQVNLGPDACTYRWRLGEFCIRW